MELGQKEKNKIAFALQGLADVFGVSLAVLDGKGSRLLEWKSPSYATSQETSNTKSIKSIEFRDLNTSVLNLDESRRRFVTRVESECDDRTIFIQSSNFCNNFAWLDGQLIPQKICDHTFTMEHKPIFLLDLFIRTIFYEILGKETLNNLDLENIRRIGISLREKINCKGDNTKIPKFSLAGTPRIENFFGHDTSQKDSIDLSVIFHGFSKENEGIFDLLSITGDTAIKSVWNDSICANYVRPKLCTSCFESDIKCLIQSTFKAENDDGTWGSLKRKCHAGFTEIFSPILVDGLIVGTAFGGQLVETQKDINKIIKYLKCDEEQADDIRSKLKPTSRAQFIQIERAVRELSKLIGLLFGKLCIAENEKKLREALVRYGRKNIPQTLHDACENIKTLLAVADCSAFLLKDDCLVLEATTSDLLHIRQKDGKLKLIDSGEALGQKYYRKDEGLTGRMINKPNSSFVKNATKVEGWIGKCNEKNAPRQVFFAPISFAGRWYGLIRSVRPADYTSLPITHRHVIERFAIEIGIILHNKELFEEKADALQDLLAIAAHEYHGPLHNIMSIVQAIRQSCKSHEREELNQELKEEAYRAKRNLDNYLSLALTGRQRERYHFKNWNISELIIRIASRFKLAAAKKGLSIIIDPSIEKMSAIICDRDRMDQVFSNILDNAVKYAFSSYDASEVSLPSDISSFELEDLLNEIYSIKIAGKETRDNVSISICDMGLGIPDHLKKEVFKGYLRPVEDEERNKPGTGLGLMIAKKYVDVHNGMIYINCKSYWKDQAKLKKNLGYFTTFVVSLPKKRIYKN